MGSLLKHEISLRCPDCRLPIQDSSCPICKRKFTVRNKPYKNLLPSADLTGRTSEYAEMPQLHENACKAVGAQKLLWDYDYIIEKTNLKLVNYLDRCKDLKVLEVGPGLGYLCHLFNKKYPENTYCAVEYERANLDYGLRVGFLQAAAFLSLGSIYSLPFESEQFDLVILSEVLEHLCDLNTAVAEIRRVLKFKGGVIASVPNSLMYLYPYPILVTLLQSIHHLGERNDRKGFRLLVRRLRRLEDDNFDGRYHRPFLPSQFRSLFMRSGFKIVRHMSSKLTYFWDPFLSNFVIAHSKSPLGILAARASIEISDRVLDGRLPFFKLVGIRQHILARKNA